MPRSILRLGFAATAVMALTACDNQGFDVDLRDQFSNGGALDTSAAARGAIASRPRPDARGVISYPSYQVAVARRGDTVVNVAGRVGLPPEELARYNGLPMDAVLRRGEIVALPRRVAEPSPATGSATTGPIVAPEDAPRALAEATAASAAASSVDVETLASDAIDRATAAPAPATAKPSPPPKIATGPEPVRHKVVAGETAYSIARRYSVPVKALAEWNGLGSDFVVRVGQYLLIPVAETRVVIAAPAPETTSKPGTGSVAPVPPSASEPLPDPEDAKPGTAAQIAPPSPDLSTQTTAAASSTARMVYPVTGKIARAYQKGKNDGIDISAPAGTPVRAADDGVVAAITRDVDQVPILVLRHSDNVLTVYAGVDQIAVNKGDRVRKGQEIARVRAKDPALLHFEVREGFDSVDPALYLE